MKTLRPSAISRPFLINRGVLTAQEKLPCILIACARMTKNAQNCAKIPVLDCGKFSNNFQCTAYFPPNGGYVFTRLILNCVNYVCCKKSAISGRKASVTDYFTELYVCSWCLGIG